MSFQTCTLILEDKSALNKAYKSKKLIDRILIIC